MTDQPATITTLTKQDLKDLAELRLAEVKLSEQVHTLTDELNKTAEGKALQAAVEARKKISDQIDLMETFIRKSALDDFIHTKVKPAFKGA